MNSIGLPLLSAVSSAAEQDIFVLSISTLITGLVVVFSILVLLVFVIKIFGMIIYGSSNRKKKKAQKKSAAKAAAAPAPAAPVPAAPVVPAAKQSAQAGISEDIIAVISAAAAVATGGRGTVVAIRESRSARGVRTAWSSAGLLESTRPF